jgi:hypothetical protein
MEAEVVPADLAQVSDEIVVTDRSRASGLFANEIFTLGRELMDTIKGRPGVGPTER